MIRVLKDRLTTPEVETVSYLEYCMQTGGEKSRLAHCLYNLIALGKASAEEVGIAVGAYDPDGIILDENQRDDTESIDTMSTLEPAADASDSAEDAALTDIDDADKEK